MKNFILFLGLLCLALTGKANESENIHELMTDEEVIQTFRTDRNAVPEYEVVPIHFPRLHKRSIGSATKIRIKAFGRNIKLWLNPTEGILVGEDTPVYIARSPGWISFSDKPKIWRVKNPMANVGSMLEDIEKQATMIVKKLKNGKNSISGTIGKKRLVIKPLPERINHHYNLRTKRSVNDLEFLQNNTMEHDEPHYHVVYKLPEQNFNNSHHTALPKIVPKVTHSRPTMRVPEVIYPQVLISIDYQTYRIHGEDMDELLTYMLPFWNGVDLKYRSVQNPKIRFNIAGIVVAADSTVFPYISKNLNSNGVLYVYESLAHYSEFSKRMVDIFPDNSYDIAVTIAPYKMCERNRFWSNNCNIVGLAYVGTACSEAKNTIVVDHGAFDGIDTTAHEIGHLFGADHDDNNKCTAEAGHIMTPYSTRTHNSADWSMCSLIQFDNFFRGQMRGSDPKCLFNKPKTTRPLTRLLPGRILTADQQCRRMFGTRSCDIGLQEKDRCVHLPCYVKGSTRQCITTMAPADGTVCAPKKICIHRKCVPESEIL